MPNICEYRFGIVNSCVYYACQTREIYSFTQGIPKPLESFEIQWVRQYLISVVLFGIKDL